MKRIALVLLALAVLLGGCTLPKYPCKADTLKWRASIESPINLYEDSVKLAHATGRYVLGPVVKDMQAARRAINDTPAPRCVKLARTLLLEQQDSQIKALLGFIENGDQQLFGNAWNNSNAIYDAYISEMDRLAGDEWHQYQGVK